MESIGKRLEELDARGQESESVKAIVFVALESKYLRCLHDFLLFPPLVVQFPIPMCFLLSSSDYQIMTMMFL